MEKDIDLIKVCNILGKSKRTVSRYIKRGLLKPEKIRGQKGIEYRFNLAEVESLQNTEATGQKTRQNQKVDIKENNTLSLLKDNMKILEKQLKSKDQQIKQLLDRQRETNYLIGQLQNKVLLLEDKNKGKRQDKNDKPSDTLSDRVKTFIDRLFGKK
ncbi:MAG: helix-turn-helix domain-containing protein [Patescibacteria group bacterium]